MKQVITYLVAFVAFTVNAQAPFEHGSSVSLDISVIEEAKDVLFDKILDTINNLVIPDVTDKKGNYMKENTFNVVGVVDKVNFQADVANNAIVFSCDQITAQFRSGKFRYHVAPLLTSKGHVEVDMNKIGLTVGLKFKTNTLPDGRMVPNIETVDINVNIDKQDIKIHLFGNLLTDLGSLFEVFFKGTVVDLITSTVQFTLETALPEIANSALNLSNGYFPVPFVKDWMVDWETPVAAEITETTFGLGVKGLMFDKKVGEKDPAVAIPVLPLHETKSQKVQARFSSYSIDSFFTSMQDVFNMQGWVNATEIPVLNTNLLNLMLPGIKGYYGADKPVNVFFRIEDLMDFGVSEKHQAFNGKTTVYFEFWVENSPGMVEKAAAITLVNIGFKFTALIEDMKLSVHIGRIWPKAVVVNFCQFGTIHPHLIKAELVGGITIATKVANHVLARHSLPIPARIIPFIELTDLSIGYYDDYIYFGVTPIFGKLPSSPIFIQ